MEVLLLQARLRLHRTTPWSSMATLIGVVESWPHTLIAGTSSHRASSSHEGTR